MKRVVLGFIYIIVMIFLIPNVLAMDGPIANISESYTAAFNPSGTYKTSPSRTGTVTVSVPNSNDVLQYVRLNVSLYHNVDFSTRTNIINNETVYRDTAWGSDYTIFLNTSNADPDTSYTINSTSYAAELNISMNITNFAGGEEFYDADNIRGLGSVNRMNVTINITNPTVLDIGSITFRCNFNSSAPAANDSLAMYTYPVALIDGIASGTVIPDDLDGDNMNDTLNWTGTIPAGKTLIIYFYASLVEGTNTPSGSTAQNFNNATSGVLHIGNNLGGRAEFTNSSGTFTGLHFVNKFARGPTRQGIDMMQNSSSHWNIRGLFDNPASSILRYNVTKWWIYIVNQTGDPNQSVSSGTDWSTALISAGDSRKYTNWYYTGSTSKPFYAPRFDWHVMWDSTTPEDYSTVINSTIDFITLNRLDISITQQNILGSVEPDTANQNLTLKHDVSMAGATSVRGNYLEIIATIPNESTDGNGYYFTVNRTSVRVFYKNTTLGYSEIDKFNYTLTIRNSSLYLNGSVNMTINDLDSCFINKSYANGIGDLDPTRNDEIRLEVQVYTPGNISIGKTFQFGGNATVISRTGTPITEDAEDKTITAGAVRMLSYKQLWIEHTTLPTIVNASIVIEVSGGTVDGIEVMDYVPMGTNFALSRVTARFKYFNGSWVTLTNASATYTYLLNSKSNLSLPDGIRVTPWNYSGNGTATTPWNGTLQSNESLEINYTINTTPGTYTLPVIIAGFDPITKKSIGSSAQDTITVIAPTAVAPLQVTDSELELAKAVIVGKPALWVKNVEIYNPNPRAIETRVEIKTFTDTGEAYASYYNELGEKVEESVAVEVREGKHYLVWNTIIGAMETRTYEIRVLTPPVLEIDRDVEVLEKLEEKKVKLKMDIYLKSFAEEDYQNVRLNLPIPYDKIIRVTDAFGEALEFTGGAGSTTIVIPEMGAGTVKTVTVIYKESYPVIIVTPDRDRYELNSPVNLVILVINGGEKLEYPYLETEVYTPQMDLVYSSIQNLNDMEPLEKTEMTEKFVIPAVAPTGTYIANARFREDFAVIASGSGNFFVTGSFIGTGAQTVEFLVILVMVLILAYFSFRRLKEIRAVPERAPVTRV